MLHRISPILHRINADAHWQIFKNGWASYGQFQPRLEFQPCPSPKPAFFAFRRSLVI